MPPVIQGEFKDLKHTSSARIDKVIDGQTILMNDGKVVRLSGVFYPFETGEAISGSMVSAKEKLERVLPQGTEVMLYQTRNAKKGRTNRMGHILAHLVARKSGEWINGAVVAYGYAYAVTDRDTPEMAEQLYKLENAAREQERGLWAKNSPHGLLSSENAAQGDGQFRAVEGRIVKAASVRNDLYLNFGKDWRKDFTVKITPVQRRLLSRKGIDPMTLPGKKVRARGWIRDWNGPFMELEIIDHLEILEESVPSIIETGQDNP